MGHLPLDGSLFYRVTPMFNLLLESALAFAEEPGETHTMRHRNIVVSPGVRGGWNLGENQLIVGAAPPVTTSGQGPSSIAVLGYFSYEIQFRRRHI